MLILSNSEQFQSICHKALAHTRVLLTYCTIIILHKILYCFGLPDQPSLSIELFISTVIYNAEFSVKIISYHFCFLQERLGCIGITQSLKTNKKYLFWFIHA